MAAWFWELCVCYQQKFVWWISQGNKTVFGDHLCKIFSGKHVSDALISFQEHLLNLKLCLCTDQFVKTSVYFTFQLWNRSYLNFCKDHLKSHDILCTTHFVRVEIMLCILSEMYTTKQNKKWKRSLQRSVACGYRAAQLFHGNPTRNVGVHTALKQILFLI